MTNGVYPNSIDGATISGAGSPIPAGPDHVVRYALNSGPGLNIPAWAVYIALAHFSDDHGLSERTHREIADAIDAGSVSTVKVAIQHLNQSQGGMCICLRRGIVLGIRQQCFGP